MTDTLLPVVSVASRKISACNGGMILRFEMESAIQKALKQ